MRTKIYSRLITLAFIAVTLLALRSYQIAHNQAAALQKMAGEMTGLQGKTAVFEKLLAAVSNMPPGSLYLEYDRHLIPSSPPGIPNITMQTLPQPTLPRGARPFEFNGQTHYYIPLANAPGDLNFVAR